MRKWELLAGLNASTQGDTEERRVVAVRAKFLVQLALGIPVTNVHCPPRKLPHIIFGTVTRPARNNGFSACLRPAPN
jgi:hypothetical protein